MTATGTRVDTAGLLRGLGADAESVVDDYDAATLVHPLLAPLDGDDLRQVYDTTVGPAGSGKSPLAVATLQFSGWDRDALTTYATEQGLPDPIASGQYGEVAVDGADPTAFDGDGGQVEVALDQEALLATAPDIDQRAYFAPNTIEGFVLGVEQVAADAMAGTNRIAALSISWGDCEAGWTSEEVAALHAALAHASAAGVTIFAASGDEGADGCGVPHAQFVDYPASDPYVVGVGGTNVTAIAPVTETGWSGSGGGSSRYFSRPAYQHATSPAATKRQVPDIASLAGAPGFIVRDGTAGSHSDVVGGTSLASPVAAGLFAAALQVRGHEAGIGNIHSQLYDAPSSSFRDVSTGNNGLPAGPGYDDVTGRGSPLWDPLVVALDTAPVLTAAAYSPTRAVRVAVRVPTGATYVGWRAGAGNPPTCASVPGASTPPTVISSPGDGTTALWVQGRTATSACYTATTVVKVDTARPTPTAAIKLAKATSSSRVRASWSPRDGTRSSGIRSVDVSVTRVGRSNPVATIHAVTGGSRTFATTQGATYRLAVVVTDRAGNRSATTRATVAVPLDDGRFHLRNRWKRHAAASAYGGAWRGTTTRHASAVLAATGRSFSLLVTKCRSCGKAAVYLDGKRVKTIDLYSSRTRYRVAVAVGTRAEGRHVVRVVNLHRHRRASHGYGVRLDALVARR